MMVTLIKVGYFLFVFLCFGGAFLGGWCTINNIERGRALVDMIAVVAGSLALIPAVIAFTSLVRWDQGRLVFFSSLDDPEPIRGLVLTPLLLAVASGLSLAARWFEFTGG